MVGVSTSDFTSDPESDTSLVKASFSVLLVASKATREFTTLGKARLPVLSYTESASATLAEGIDFTYVLEDAVGWAPLSSSGIAEKAGVELRESVPSPRANP